MTWHIFISLDA